jgi:hypothetical protein
MFNTHIALALPWVDPTLNRTPLNRRARPSWSQRTAAVFRLAWNEIARWRHRQASHAAWLTHPSTRARHIRSQAQLGMESMAEEHAAGRRKLEEKYMEAYDDANALLHVMAAMREEHAAFMAQVRSALGFEPCSGVHFMFLCEFDDDWVIER